MSATGQSYLRRLDSSFYRGLGIVHWTHTIEGRKRGWLNDRFHRQFRELLIHAGGKFSVWTPAYCLMPDHFHLVWMGVDRSSDQQEANQWLRRHLNRLMKASGFELQKQAFDRVLRENEKDRFSFERLVGYVMDNPDRADLMSDGAENTTWPFRDSILPAYPEISWAAGADEFWERFWKVYYARIEPQ